MRYLLRFFTVAIFLVLTIAMILPASATEVQLPITDNVVYAYYQDYDSTVWRQATITSSWSLYDSPTNKVVPVYHFATISGIYVFLLPVSTVGTGYDYTVTSNQVDDFTMTFCVDPNAYQWLSNAQIGYTSNGDLGGLDFNSDFEWFDARQTSTGTNGYIAWTQTVEDPRPVAYVAFRFDVEADNINFYLREAELNYHGRTQEELLGDIDSSLKDLLGKFGSTALLPGFEDAVDKDAFIIDYISNSLTDEIQGNVEEGFNKVNDVVTGSLLGITFWGQVWGLICGSVPYFDHSLTVFGGFSLVSLLLGGSSVALGSSVVSSSFRGLVNDYRYSSTPRDVLDDAYRENASRKAFYHIDSEGWSKRYF